ncbi:uncharacterized protein FIBRA_02030 [Fibroporia radiculosa]|uniref:Uncharacterized protein n=1 Tax=Fibroporia radiculosa TaxID=599839 RepID=J4GM62_9APHY|nr:uncharacterized protein FIBRA_02030 [Fibroporia radiculosa]CCM00005.1 predicted protein [Fibroporia radiculosa]
MPAARKNSSVVMPVTKAIQSRQPAFSSVTFRSAAEQDPDLSDAGEDNAEYGGTIGDDDNGMLEMLNMLQEFQKRKASKTSTRSAVFQNKKNALIADARKNTETIVREGVLYMHESFHASVTTRTHTGILLDRNQFSTMIAELKAQENSPDLNGLSQLWESQNDLVNDLLGMYPSLIDNLSHRRADQIDGTSAMLEAHVAERQNSRRRLILNAKGRMDENIERQKLATDAAALIKHFKALLLS